MPYYNQGLTSGLPNGQRLRVSRQPHSPRSRPHHPRPRAVVKEQFGLKLDRMWADRLLDYKSANGLPLGIKAPDVLFGFSQRLGRRRQVGKQSFRKCECIRRAALQQSYGPLLATLDALSDILWEVRRPSSRNVYCVV
jgi:hypothetical protein